MAKDQQQVVSEMCKCLASFLLLLDKLYLGFGPLKSAEAPVIISISESLKTLQIAWHLSA